MPLSDLPLGLQDMILSERIAEECQLKARCADLLAALQTIADGDLMAGRKSWTLADVVHEQGRIARAAIAKATA